MATGDRIKLMGGTEFFDLTPTRFEGVITGNRHTDVDVINVTGKGIVTHIQVDFNNRSTSGLQYFTVYLYDENNNILLETTQRAVNNGTTTLSIPLLLPINNNFSIKTTYDTTNANTNIKIQALYLM